MRRRESNLIPALLKHWRTHRGMSQLDLALAAEVSARHLSFLENGRAQPSRDMLLRLASVLGVPLRDRNALLVAAGFPEAFPSPPPDRLGGPIGQALERMLAQHEPFPMVVTNRRYDLVRANAGGQRLLARLVDDPVALGAPPNLVRVLFDPRLARPYIVDWERVAREILMRLHRECLDRPGDPELTPLLQSLLELPGVPRDWHTPDLAAPSEPCFSVQIRRGDLALGFFTTVTVFNAPHSVTLEDLRIESYFPLDEATRRACERL